MKRSNIKDFFITSSIAMALSVAFFIASNNKTTPNFVYLFLSIGIPYIVTYYIFKILTEKKPESFKKDLKYLGFNGAFFTIQNGHHKSIGNINNPIIFGSSFVADGAKPSNRFIAFFSYGFKTLATSKVGALSADEYSELIVGYYLVKKSFATARRLVFETLKEAKKVIKQQEVDTKLNPVPYAAYLFRMASLHNNPENKDVQEKALILWRDGRNLDLVFRLRVCAMQQIESFADIPDAWVEELAELQANDVD